MDNYPYKDLESLLFRCFITKPYTVAGTPLLIKSLTEHEFDYINETYHYLDSEDDKLVYYIAYSLLQIEGKSILHQREEVLDDVIEVVKDWPYELMMMIAGEMTLFRDRVRDALDLLEVYTYTDNSRMRWFSYKNKLLNDPQITGWRGTENLALSTTQLSWITLNKIEDDKSRYESINDAARFIATVFNYKGMKPINDEEMKRRKDEYNRKKDLVEKINNSYREDEKLGSNLRDKNLVLSPEERKNMDAKDLVEELNRMKMGVKDEHDFRVEEYEKAMKKIYLEDKKKKEDLVIARVRNNPDPYLVPVAVKSRVLKDETELDNSRDQAYRDFIARKQQISEMENIQIEKPIVDRFRAMAKLEDEEEDMLYRDVYKEISEEYLKNTSVNNSISGKRIIVSQTMEDLKNQTG